MDVREAIHQRRSVKRFRERVPSEEEIEDLLGLAVLAPNHRMTEPWSFRVLGPEGRRAYGEALGARKARKVEDPDAAGALHRKTLENAVSVPLMVGVIQHLADDLEVREEDYASCYMGVQNICLGAVGMGLATHVKTGAVLEDPPLRKALGVAEGERLVALLHVGEPAEIPDPKPRTPARERTRWLP